MLSQLKENKKVAAATHNILAYRYAVVEKAGMLAGWLSLCMYV